MGRWPSTTALPRGWGLQQHLAGGERAPAYQVLELLVRGEILPFEPADIALLLARLGWR